jgi:hypothetical protein
MATVTKTKSQKTIQTKNGPRTYNYGPVKIGAVTYKNKKKAIIQLLKRSKMPQHEIATKIGVTEARVSQVKKEEGLRTPEGRSVGSKKRIR